MRRQRDRNAPSDRQRGQAIVIFALSLVAILAMSGLVLDGGAAFAQRRSTQSAADLAAVAGATAYGNALSQGGSEVEATAGAEEVARQVAEANGFLDDGQNAVEVDVAVDPNALAGRTLVTVSITKPRVNSFAAVVGQPVWDVTAVAVAATGFPNAANGVMPIIFNERALGTDNGHDPWAVGLYNLPTNSPNLPKDVPQDETQFNWTVFCLGGGNECNGDSNTVDSIINQQGYQTTVTLDMLIGPLNAGAHTGLFNDMAQWVDTDFPVPVVDSFGAMQGWAIFHLIDVQGGSNKLLEGYFVNTLNHEALTIVQCECSAGYYGSYTVKLIE